MKVEHSKAGTEEVKNTLLLSKQFFFVLMPTRRVSVCPWEWEVVSNKICIPATLQLFNVSLCSMIFTFVAKIIGFMVLF